MTAIHIDSFGGELPRVSPKALPDAGAQVNRNLLATWWAREIRADTDAPSRRQNGSPEWTPFDPEASCA